MILYSLLPFYKKERINYNSEIEQNKVAYRKLVIDLKDKRTTALEEADSIQINSKLSWKDKELAKRNKNNRIKEIRTFFDKQLVDLKRKHKDSILQAKINFMAAVSKNKELKENVKLIRKSKSNLHRVLYDFTRLPFDEKKNSLVVQEISPSKGIEFSIKKRIFKDLDTYGNKETDRMFASDKDIMFTTFNYDKGTEKIPIVLRYSGQCVPIYLDKVRDDTYEQFSNENEHHLELLCARFRETKAPHQGLKISRQAGMIIIGVILMIGYFVYKYYNGGF